MKEKTQMWPKTPTEAMNEWMKSYINDQEQVCSDEEWEKFCKDMNLQTDGPVDEDKTFEYFAEQYDAFMKELKKSNRF